MKVRNRKLLRAAVFVAVGSLLNLAAAFVLVPSQLPFADFEEDPSYVMAVMYLLLQPVNVVASQVCSNRLVPTDTDEDDEEAPAGEAKDAEHVAVRGDPEAGGGKY